MKRDINTSCFAYKIWGYCKDPYTIRFRGLGHPGLAQGCPESVFNLLQTGTFLDGSRADEG